MKLLFFLIAFCLVTLRVYFSWSGMEKARMGESECDMVIKSDHSYEEINYSGKFQISDDEAAFKSISPGGYFKFRKDDIKVKAVSNLRGEINYTIYDGKNYLPYNGEGKTLLNLAIKEMIYWGYDAQNRMERVYSRGGAQALINEIDSVKTDQAKILYLTFLLRVDSLAPAFTLSIFKKLSSIGSDIDKVKFLRGISKTQLRNPLIDTVYFEIVKSMSADDDKLTALQYFLDQDSLSNQNIFSAMILSNSFSSDVDKSTLFKKMIERGQIHGANCDSLLVFISRIGSDPDKVDLYRMISEKNFSEIQWISLLNKISNFGSDVDKSNLLADLAKIMPKTETVKLTYRKTAKTIGNDSDFGRTMRAIE